MLCCMNMIICFETKICSAVRKIHYSPSPRKSGYRKGTDIILNIFTNIYSPMVMLFNRYLLVTVVTAQLNLNSS